MEDQEESTERTYITADLNGRSGRIDRESLNHGWFEWKIRKNRPRELISRL